MTYLQKSPTSDKTKKKLNDYPIMCFLKNVIDNNTHIEEANKFGNNVTTLLNSFDHKYKTVFKYNGDITTEDTDIAVHVLLIRDVHKYCFECYLSYIKNSSFFEGEFLMDTFFEMMQTPKVIFVGLRSLATKN